MTSNGKRSDKKSPWVRPRLTVLGDLREIVRGGGGKLTTFPRDGGEPRKPPGLG